MSLFDDVVSAAGGQKGLGGIDIQQIASHLSDGGLEAIVTKFKQGGAAEVVQSWIGTGANLPVSADQLHAILGSEQVGGLAKSLGIDPSQLATALPGLIDRLTPGGQLPQGGIGDILGQALSEGGLNGMLGGLFKS